MMVFLWLAQIAEANTWKHEAERCFGSAKITWMDEAPAQTPTAYWCEAGGLGYQLDGKVKLRKLQATVPALKLKEAGKGLQALTEKDVLPTHIDVAAREWFHEREQFSVPSVTGQRLRAYFSKGHVLRSRDLAPVPAILRGQTVSVKVESGAVSIKRQGLMEQDGVIGQEVNVKLGSKRLTGRVEADGAVVVHL